MCGAFSCVRREHQRHLLGKYLSMIRPSVIQLVIIKSRKGGVLSLGSQF